MAGRHGRPRPAHSRHFGGALLYVVAQSWYLHVTAGGVARTRWAACAVLAAGGCVAVILPRLAGLALLLVILAALTWQLTRDH